ncbi:MAG: CRP-like cAMP-binding protein [Crocinitomicaceae bacterium]|jgi:CRP-like cAMP-binding protein
MLSKDFYINFDFKSDFLLDALDKDEIHKVTSTFEDINFSKGDKLFYEDGVPTGVFYIQKGKAKKYKSAFDQEQIFYIYKDGDLLGYHALLSQERYQDSCSALTDMEVKFISGENFNRLLHEIPKLKDAVIVNMAHEFGVMANFISILAQKSQVLRLGIFLMVLDHRFNSGKSKSEGVNIPREDLANLIGTSKESLSRSLKVLKDLSLISVDKRTIHIKKQKELLALVQG